MRGGHWSFVLCHWRSPNCDRLRRLVLLSLFSSILYPLSSVLSPAQTVYAVVFGDQSKVVGASTLNSGLFRSADLGLTWEHLGPQNLKAFSMDAVDSVRGRILFIAAGNGVHRSLDSGRTWRVTTDWRITEVLDVAVKQDDPRWVYAATAYGVWFSSDTGSTWRPAHDASLARYSYRLMIDRDRLLVARKSDVAIVPLPDLEASVTQRRIAVPLPRSFMRERGSSGDVIVAGRGRAAFLEVDTFRFDDTVRTSRGDSAVPLAGWKTYGVDGLPRGNWYDACFNAIDEQVLCGDSGVWRLHSLWDSALPVLWSNISDGLPTRVVHTLVSIPTSTSFLLLAGTWGNGVWAYNEEGASFAKPQWKQSGLEGCQVWRLVVKPW